jgi:L-fuconolactonase
VSTEPEEILEPELPIIDPHHHLTYSPHLHAPADDERAEFVTLYHRVEERHRRYLFDEFLLDASSGHDIRATVHVEANSMYRTAGPAELRPVGETEFANGVATMAATGLFGDTLVCAGIVGKVDYSLGDRVAPVLEAHIAAGGGRFRGVRASAMTAHPSVFDTGIPEGWLLDATVQASFARLAPLGLTLDVTVLEPQLADVVALARRFPETSLILDHTGFPLGIGIYRGRRDERFPIWLQSMRDLAACENVVVKLGGLGTPIPGFDSFLSDPPAPSETLAREWAPYIESSIDLFGAARCMFESNFPPDSGAGSYATIWNAFKRLAAHASPDEKHDLFSGTAARTYAIRFGDVVR